MSAQRASTDRGQTEIASRKRKSLAASADDGTTLSNYLAHTREAYRAAETWTRKATTEVIQQAEQCWSREQAEAKAATRSIVSTASEVAGRLEICSNNPQQQIHSREEQVARNVERTELLSRVTTCTLKLGNLSNSLLEHRPLVEDNGLLEQLGRIVSILTDVTSQAKALQHEVEQDLSRQREALARSRASEQAAICKELQPVLPNLLAFASRVAEELQDESTEEKQLLERTMTSLQHKEAAFLRANVSPSKNKEYQDVREQIEDAKSRHSDLVSSMSAKSKEVCLRNDLQEHNEKVSSFQLTAQQDTQNQPWKKRAVEWLKRYCSKAGA
eukprot:TRINITY_DN28994_c0_g1_i1.p1 TRINITY_DN28994_c0_g1~~TRINITY_DN28994_c0_g1_i1.p1  ORF type:complete len:330 (-),score=63.60 TRINITY_DN28994_c0_g1_i1:11-1000(-)